jgi:hypothetical protein
LLIHVKHKSNTKHKVDLNILKNLQSCILKYSIILESLPWRQPKRSSKMAIVNNMILETSMVISLQECSNFAITFKRTSKVTICNLFCTSKSRSQQVFAKGQGQSLHLKLMQVGASKHVYDTLIYHFREVLNFLHIFRT